MSEAEMKCELMIIGGGFAGMAASVFAADKGVKTFQAGSTADFSLVSGLIDLMGVFPISDGTVHTNPFNAIEAVTNNMPEHPMAKISKSDITTAIDRMIDLLNKNGLQYICEKEKNQMMITSAGTVKPTYCIPYTMSEGVKAYQEKVPCLIVDIERLKGFSSRQVAETLKDEWPDISFATIAFPEKKGEIFAEAAAVALEHPDVLKQFAESIIPHINGSKVVGFPAILGLEKSQKVKETLEKLIGLPVFEIPMLPPSLPGIRLRNTIECSLKKQGVTLIGRRKVLSVENTVGGNLLFTMGDESGKETVKVEAEAAILASGRFLGGGLNADYSNITETLFGIPVVQPEARGQWHNKDFFNKEGHPINAAGIETDLFFRPLNSDGKPFLDTLFAAGSILANNDWMRMKSGAGCAITTAFAAVNSYLKFKK